MPTFAPSASASGVTFTLKAELLGDAHAVDIAGRGPQLDAMETQGAEPPVHDGCSRLGHESVSRQRRCDPVTELGCREHRFVTVEADRPSRHTIFEDRESP